MNRPLSGQSVSLRPVRRSLIEFTMPAIDRAEVEKRSRPKLTVLPPPVVSPPVKAPRPKAAKPKQSSPPERIAKHRRVAAGNLPRPHHGKVPERANVLRPIEGLTSLAAKGAKDYRAWILRHMQDNVGTALGYVRRVTAASLSAEAVSSASSGAPDAKDDPKVAEAEQNISAHSNAAAEFCTKALDLMAANVNATLEYAQQLSDAKTASEFVQLSTCHFRKQVELAVAHSTEFRALSHLLTAERRTGRRRPD